jgi:tripartite-type tricarboxylate transporter receptor subunit TctC
MILKRTVLTVMAAVSIGLNARDVAAQGWPIRPVTMVVPFAAGGATDVLGRIVGMRLSELLGQQVIVENIGAAGGMTGSARVAKAPPDGHEFVLGSTSTHAVNQTLYKNPLYNAAIDFTPVALIAEQPLVLIARKDLPAGNLKEFIAYAKVNQGRMQYGSAGAGSTAHLTCALLNAAIGVDITHIPYRGGAPAMQDLVASRIDYFCAVSTTAIPLIEGGQVKAIAVLTKNRSPSLPALASAHEQGISDFDAPIWYAIFLPKRAPAAIVQKLHSAVIATVNTPDVQRRLKEIGAELVAPERRSSEYLQRFVENEIEKWAGPIKASGVSMD